MLTILTLKMLLMIVYLAHWDWILTQSRKDIVSNISNSKFMAVCPIDVNKNELENLHIPGPNIEFKGAIFSLPIKSSIDKGLKLEILTVPFANSSIDGT